MSLLKNYVIIQWVGNFQQVAFVTLPALNKLYLFLLDWRENGTLDCKGLSCVKIKQLDGAVASQYLWFNEKTELTCLLVHLQFSSGRP